MDQSRKRKLEDSGDFEDVDDEELDDRKDDLLYEFEDDAGVTGDYNADDYDFDYGDDEDDVDDDDDEDDDDEDDDNDDDDDDDGNNESNDDGDRDNDNGNGNDQQFMSKRRRIMTQSKAKNSLVPVQNLSLFLCCSLFCLSGIPVEDLCLLREHYHDKSRQEKSQFIMDTLLLNMSANGDCGFMVGPKKVCAMAWRTVLGVSSSTFYYLKKQITEGSKTVGKSGRQEGTLERKTQVAFIWLRQFTSTFASAMPDSNKLHLPSCLTKTAVYEQMEQELGEIGEPIISKTHFFRVWRSDLRHIAIPKRSRFSECTVCALLKKSLSESKSKEVRDALKEQRKMHLWQQRSERQKYYKHQLKAKMEPRKYLSIIMDSMDQNKTMLPHFAKTPKAVDGMWKVKTHLLAAKIHGVGIYGFFDFFQYPHGSNLTITSLLSIFHMLKDSLPDVLYLQMDNCGHENKNRFVLAFLCQMVEMGIFKKVKLSFLMKGHTHEDIDQLFSRFSVWLNKNNALSVEELMKGFENCYTPQPLAIVTPTVINYSDFVSQYINPMTRHSKPHVFRIAKDNGKAKISCKKWTTDKMYQDCIGSEKYLLQNLPESDPTLCKPNYSELEKAKESIKVAHPFMSAAQKQSWETFFKEKEEEELNFQLDGDNPVDIRNLASYIQECRKDKENTTPDIPQIVHDGETILPVVIGKNIQSKTSPRQEENTGIDDVSIHEGDMCLTNLEKYCDEWPQVAKVLNIEDEDITVQWYKGSKSSSWNPCTIPVPGQRGKRMPWKETIQMSDIWLSGFLLTNRLCLPKNVKDQIDQFDI